MFAIFKYAVSWQYKRYTRAVVEYLVPFFKPQDSVLDLGSGNGFMAHTLAQMTGCSITCVDVIDISLIGPKPVLYDGSRIPFEAGKFSAVLCICVLHHIRDKESIIAEIKRVSNSLLVVVEDVSRNPVDDLLGVWHRLISRIKYKSAYVVFKTDREWKAFFSAHHLHLIHEEELKRRVNWTHPCGKKMYILQTVDAGPK